MRWFICIFFLNIFYTSKGQVDSTLVYSFLTTRYSLLLDKDNIPKSFFKGYKKITKKDFVIADNEETFNPTDVMYNGVPNKKLIFAGLDSIKRTGFIFYRQGGQVVTSHVLLFDISLKRKPKMFGIYLSKEPQNLEELKSIVGTLRKL